MHQGRLLACDTVDGVKGLMRGALLEVQCDRPREAAKALPPGKVALYGDRMHVRVENGDLDRQKVEAALKAAGFKDIAIRLIEPSLEDVFTSSIPKGEA